MERNSNPGMMKYLAIALGAILVIVSLILIDSTSTIQEQTKVLRRGATETRFNEHIIAELRDHIDSYAEALEKCHSKLPYDSLAEAESIIHQAYADYIWNMDTLTRRRIIGYEEFKMLYYIKKDTL